MTPSLPSQLKAAQFRIASLQAQLAGKDATIRDLKDRMLDSKLRRKWITNPKNLGNALPEKQPCQPRTNTLKP